MYSQFLLFALGNGELYGLVSQYKNIWPQNVTIDQ